MEEVPQAERPRGLNSCPCQLPLLLHLPLPLPTDHTMDPLQNALARIERGDEKPCEWHVLWVIALSQERAGLFTERSELRHTVDHGHISQADAEHYVRTHNYHHRFRAWLFNAHTGESVLVEPQPYAGVNKQMP